MTKKVLNSPTRDNALEGSIKINDNFTELYDFDLTCLLTDGSRDSTGGQLFTGHIAVGNNAAVSSSSVVSVNETVTDQSATLFDFDSTLGGTATVGNTLQGFNVNMIYSQVSSVATGGLSGMIFNVTQFSTGAMSNLVGGTYQVNSTAGTGAITSDATALNLKALYSATSGTVTKSVGLNVGNMGASVVTTSTGIEITKQSGGTNNYGLVMLGNGVGSDLVQGAGRNASWYYDGNDYVCNPKLVGSGRVDILGDLIHDGYYGAFYQNEVPTTITVSVTNTWYRITGNTTGLLNGMTFAADVITISAKNAGKYLVNWSVALYDGSGVQNFEVGTDVNGTVDITTVCHATTKGANESEATSGTGILNLAVGDTVGLMIRNTGSTNNPVINHATFTLTWVGK